MRKSDLFFLSILNNSMENIVQIKLYLSFTLFIKKYLMAEIVKWLLKSFDQVLWQKATK